MPLLDSTLNAILDGTIADFTATVTRMSLHSDDPGTDGSNETTAARQTIVWLSPVGGDLSLSTTYTFSGGTPNGPVTHVGLWDADDLTFRGSFAVTGAATFDANGQYAVTSGTIAGSSTG